MFAVITKVTGDSLGLDKVLQLPLLQLSKEQLIVGLPAFDSRKLYILHVQSMGSSDATDQPLLLHCNWDIEFL